MDVSSILASGFLCQQQKFCFVINEIPVFASILMLFISQRFKKKEITPENAIS